MDLPAEKGTTKMKKELFRIWPKDQTVTLTTYCAEAHEANRPVIIVLPGGAYIAPSPKESDPVAKHFAEMGYFACVLRTSTMYLDYENTDGPANPHTIFPEPMQELATAIKFLRDRADDFKIARDKIALMGFSAGGHLASNYCNWWNSEQVLGSLGFSKMDICPNADILCYGVTELSNVSGDPMLRAVFGGRDSYDREEVRQFDAPHHVSSATPPTFIWHTADDECVPVRQSYNMALALDHGGVPYEVHIFSSGPHASALSAGLPAQHWPELADSFLKRYL